MIWKISEANPRTQSILSESLGISSVLAQLLLNRNVYDPEAARSFLFGDISSCPDPFLMKDMEKAVGRIKKAVAGKEKILICGDYDVDGVTSTALLAYVLEEIGADVDTFIPHRIKDGYGLSDNAIKIAIERGADVLVTVDCGSNAFEQIDHAMRSGIDVIVTDHHEVKEKKDHPAFAVINPQQEDCNYPYKHLSGVGVAYKFARALTKGSEEIADRHLDLVALGTIADISPMSGENRILTRLGLDRIRNTEKAGLKSLMEYGRITPEKLSCRHVGFVLGPRINAMGRIGSAEVALELMLCADITRANEIAGIMERENKNRREIERGILKEATSMVKKDVDLDLEKAIVLADEDWHPGVIGIVASRMTEQFNVPAILIALDGDNGKGSGRSIKGFNLFDAIMKASSHLVDFGGHEAACGIKILKKDISGFREKISEVAKEFFAQGYKAESELPVDISLPLSKITTKVINELMYLMPYGPGNREPVFASTDLTVKNNPRDIGKTGFKFLVSCGNITCEAVTFRKSSVAKPSRGDIIDLAYTPSINSWNGIDTIQLNIKDIREAA